MTRATTRVSAPSLHANTELACAPLYTIQRTEQVAEYRFDDPRRQDLAIPDHRYRRQGARNSREEAESLHRMPSQTNLCAAAVCRPPVWNAPAPMVAPPNSATVVD